MNSFTPYYGEDEKLSELLEFFLFNDIKILENADRIFELINTTNYNNFDNYRDNISQSFTFLINYLSAQFKKA